jgi:hypothetical protein
MDNQALYVVAVVYVLFNCPPCKVIYCHSLQICKQQNHALVSINRGNPRFLDYGVDLHILFYG